MQTNDVIIKPILTELSLRSANLGWFTFEVSIQANKQEIKNAIEKNFNVNVVNVKTNITKSRKNTRVGKAKRRVLITKVKKARVKLAKDQKIQLFEGLEDGKKT